MSKIGAVEAEKKNEVVVGFDKSKFKITIEPVGFFLITGVIIEKVRNFNDF